MTINPARTKEIEQNKSDLAAQTRINARKEMARELLDDIKYSTEGMEDNDILLMVIGLLCEIEENG